MILVWFEQGAPFLRVPSGLASRKEIERAAGQASGRFLAGFYGVDMVLIGFDAILMGL